MNKNMDEKRDEALSFLVAHDVGVLATVGKNNQPGARMVYYICDDSFAIYFLTFNNTRKVSDLSLNPLAAFVVSEIDIPRTIQIEGEVTDLTNTATLNPLLSGFVHRLMTDKPYGIPLSHFDSGEIKFFKLTPSWIRWGDFTFGKGTNEVLSEIVPEPE